MNSSNETTLAPATEPGRLTRFLRRRLLDQLDAISWGKITLVERSGITVLGDPDAALGVSVEVNDPTFFRHAALGGTVGAGEAYMLGLWSCDDLTGLVRILVRNREVLDGLETGLARASMAVLQLWHRLRRNTRGGARTNIAAHYDLGNEFFALMLDQSLMYSSGIYADARTTLAEAQTAKLERICRKLELGPGDQVMEIGTGWGGFAIYAARNFGCRVTTTTISQAQFEVADRRVADAGLADRITVLKQDYRDLRGRYDKLVSIEMIEAVGHHYLPTYLEKIASLLTDEGMALIQAITIEDHRYEKALREVDFIKRYIFPGSFIPSVAAIASAMAQRTDLRLYNLEDIGPSYARTLADWRARFSASLPEIRRLGYPETFVRMWEFYLCYCEGGFLERSIGNAQLLLTKPGCRRASVLGSLRGA